ncbi:MAG: hypothetical protein KDA61_06800, partial [Planctomycetales bacterium]|nr:hypothetical protein [Planctomycetales bacterium]
EWSAGRFHLRSLLAAPIGIPSGPLPKAAIPWGLPPAGRGERMRFWSKVGGGGYAVRRRVGFANKFWLETVNFS